jgi:hypothetical protein
MARSPRSARTRDGAVARSSAARWQGATGELAGATGRAPGKAVRGGAHPSGGAMERQQRMLRAAAFVGAEGAPVTNDVEGVAL